MICAMSDQELPSPAATAGPARLPLSQSDEIVAYGPLRGAAPGRALKRLLRRGLRWYLWPATERMTAHNRAVGVVLAHHRHQLTWLRQEAERLDRDLDLM